MTLELANHAICTPDGITRDVFVPVGKFTFLADFVFVDYESDPRVPLISRRPFLRTARALIDVHDKEMILRDGDERLTLNMKHDTASYSNHPYRESVNLINIFNFSSEDCLKDLVSYKQSGNPTFSLHKEIASPEVIHEFNDSKGCTFLSEELPDIDSFNDIHPHFNDDPLSGSTTYSANSLLEEFADELALISYPPDYNDNHLIDQSVLTHCDDLFIDPTPEMFTEEQPPDYSFPPRFDVYPDDFLEIESDATFDDGSFDSEGEKIKEAELLIDPLDLLCDILFEYDSFNSQDFSRDDVFFSPDNEDKVFNPGILSHDKSVKIITQVTQEKKLSVSYASCLEVMEIVILDVGGIDDDILLTIEHDVLNDSYELTDELIPFISAPEYDCFLFKVEPNSRDFTKDVVENISPTKEPQVLTVLPTHPTLQLKMKFQPFSESFFAYVVWIFLPFLVYSVAPPYLLSLRNEDIIFDPGICNSHFSRPDISHRCGTVKKFNTHRSHLNKCPMLIHGQNNPHLDVLLFHFYPL
nr:reverse transcriptase domain-containing protein [Tanacetum cinerariifolium]